MNIVPEIFKLESKKLLKRLKKVIWMKKAS